MDTEKITCKLPYSYFIWIALNVIFSVLAFTYNNWIYAACIEVVLGIVSYAIICRYACTIVFDDDKLLVKYWFPFFLDRIEVPIIASDMIRCKWGEYLIIRRNRPYETISFYRSEDENSFYREIKVNANYFDFKKLQKQLEKKVHGFYEY